MKILIDECLSPQLATHAINEGHGESSHVVWLGAAGWPDWKLLTLILDGDWTFVTKNSVDFRGPAKTPGSKGEYRRAEVHAGLICLNGPPGMDLVMQMELFRLALEDVALAPDLTNQVLEIFRDDGFEDVDLVRYDLPKS